MSSHPTRPSSSSRHTTRSRTYTSSSLPINYPSTIAPGRVSRNRSSPTFSSLPEYQQQALWEAATGEDLQLQFPSRPRSAQLLYEQTEAHGHFDPLDFTIPTFGTSATSTSNLPAIAIDPASESYGSISPRAHSTLLSQQLEPETMRYFAHCLSRRWFLLTPVAAHWSTNPLLSDIWILTLLATSLRVCLRTQCELGYISSRSLRLPCRQSTACTSFQPSIIDLRLLCIQSCSDEYEPGSLT